MAFYQQRYHTGWIVDCDLWTVVFAGRAEDGGGKKDDWRAFIVGGSYIIQGNLYGYLTVYLINTRLGTIITHIQTDILFPSSTCRFKCRCTPPPRPPLTTPPPDASFLTCQFHVFTTSPIPPSLVIISMAFFGPSIYHQSSFPHSSVTSGGSSTSTSFDYFYGSSTIRECEFLTAPRTGIS